MAQSLSELRQAVLAAYARIGPVEPAGHPSADLNWAVQMCRPTGKPSLDPRHQAEAEEMIRSAMGTASVEEGLAVYDAATALYREWEQAITEAFRAYPHDQFTGDAFAYARRFTMLPDDAIAHVRNLPAEERGRWFFGFWTAPSTAVA